MLPPPAEATASLVAGGGRGSSGRIGVSGDVHSPQQHGRGPGPSSGSSSEAVSWQGGSWREFTQPKRPRGKAEHRTFPTFEGLWVCASLAGHPLSLPLLLSPQERAPSTALSVGAFAMFAHLLRTRLGPLSILEWLIQDILLKDSLP